VRRPANQVNAIAVAVAVAVVAAVAVVVKMASKGLATPTLITAVMKTMVMMKKNQTVM
jgi:alkylhydroperoxidase/carboxymuconolactone decarboxylase family protein YurZ